MTKVCVVLIALAGLLPADNPKEEAVKQEKEKLAGTWALTALEVNGQTLPEDAIKDIRYVFTAEKLTRKRGDKIESEAGYRLDLSKSPRWIDMTGKQDGKDHSVPGLYALNGDRLQFCFRMDYKKPGQAAEGLVRPSKLEAGKGSEQVLMTLKREKP
jgi:uncharacterized protein (TIGR03067 family)